MLLNTRKSTTTSKLDMQVKLHVDKLNTLMNKGLPELIYFDNHLTSSSDCFLDNFDSPLSLMDNRMHRLLLAVSSDVTTRIFV